MFPGILPKDKGFIVKQNNQASNGKLKNQKSLDSASQCSSTASEKSRIHLKNYNFTLPSVAVWQDLNELESAKDYVKNKASKKKNLKKIKRSHAEEAVLVQETEELDRMKRNKGVRKEGSFIHPSEFTLNQSVMVPMSRAGIRLQPLKNAPVPNIEEKHENLIFNSNIRENTKVFMPEKSMIIDKLYVDKPNFKSAPDHRQHTELVPEPKFVLEENYKSDGELDSMEYSDEEPRKTSPEKINEIEQGLFPVIAQIIETKAELPDNNRTTLPVITKLAEKTDESKPLRTLETKKDVRPALPVFKLSQDAKKTARYTLKNRSIGSKRSFNIEKKKDEKFTDRKKSIKNSNRKGFPGNGFVVGIARTKPKPIEKQQKRIVRDQKEKMISKGKQDVPLKIDKPVREIDAKVLPASTKERVPIVESLSEKESGIGSQEMEDDYEVEIMDLPDDSEPVTEVIMTTPPTNAAKIDRIASRAMTPKVLEYPLHLMIKIKKDFIQKKREEFRKIDIDGDGHLSLFELMRCFPSTLSRQQVDYLKMIYQKACNSTFFGLEEFLCVDEMCKTMVDIGDVLTSVYNQLELKSIQENLDVFLVKFAEAYHSSSGLAVFKNLLDRRDQGRGGSSLEQVRFSFQELGKDLTSGIGKADFLLLIPVLVTEGLMPEDLSV